MTIQIMSRDPADINKIQNKLPFIWDGHACPPFSKEGDLRKLNKYKEAGFGFISLNVGYGKMETNEILPIIERIKIYIENNPEEFYLVNKFSDIEKYSATNKIGIAFDIEGAHSIRNNLDILNQYKILGIRQMLLAYNQNNDAAGGCHDLDKGLTKYGKKIIHKLNGLGIIVDCSHTSHTSTLDIMNESSKPVVFSHANSKKIHPHPRNLTDEQIKHCAATNGVIGICGISIFLGTKKQMVERFVDNIDYISNLVGYKHVGIGLDYVLDQNEIENEVKKNKILFPSNQGYDEVNMLEPGSIKLIKDELIKRGYLPTEITAILGGNYIRVAKEVWE